MDRYPLHVRLAMPLAAATIIFVALGAAALQGPKIVIPIAVAFIFGIGAVINVVSRPLLKLRGQKPKVATLWMIFLIGGLFAAPLLGLAALLTWLFKVAGNGLLVHAEVLLLVAYAVINTAGLALFNLIALFRPAPAANR